MSIVDSQSQSLAGLPHKQEYQIALLREDRHSFGSGLDDRCSLDERFSGQSRSEVALRELEGSALYCDRVIGLRCGIAWNVDICPAH